MKKVSLEVTKTGIRVYKTLQVQRKHGRKNVVAVLEIPFNLVKLHLTEKKSRASALKVVRFESRTGRVLRDKVAYGLLFNKNFMYDVGAIVIPERKFDDRCGADICSSGIHFYFDRASTFNHGAPVNWVK